MSKDLERLRIVSLDQDLSGTSEYETGILTITLQVAQTKSTVLFSRVLMVAYSN
jgi:hypothetical protein